MILPSLTYTSLKPFYIGDIAITIPLTLAPMAGHTHRAFRDICREQGACGLVCTELLSSAIMTNKGGLKKSLRLFDWSPEEYPFAVQLFGHEPHIVAEAAKIVADYGAAIVDINMGCWVPKIAGKGGGAALLRDICTATAVVKAVVKAVTVPVTVKVRSGWEDGMVTAIPFAKAAEDVGARAIAVHARFAKQGFNGDADWDIIRQVKENVRTIPVIGNGDVTTPQAAARMLALTGCDGVMIGRGALGRPWIFRHIAHYLETGELLPEPTRAERARIALRHAQLTLTYSIADEKRTVLELRGQLSKYALDEVGSVHIRNQLVRAETMDDIERILSTIT